MPDYYKGRRVLFFDGGELIYWSNLFDMLESFMGVNCCMKSDPELWLHFRAILDRLAVLTHDADVSEVVTLFLAD